MASGDLVVFDAGGVLVRICRTWAEGAARAGVAAPPQGVAAPEAIDRRRALSNLYQSGRMTAEEYFAQLAASVGSGCDAELAQRIHDAWLIDEYPGVGALINDLHAAGIATALLSNTNERHYRVMATPGGLYPAVAALGAWFVSHELGACKPEPRIYEAVERAVGRGPDQIIFFDDLEENIAAAARRGWRAHQIDHAGDTAAQMRARLRDLRIL